MSPVSFFTQLLNGLQLGSIYALVALGYTMVYGIILLLNFAHGDIIMAGAYISWIAMAQLGIHPALAALLSIFGCMALGVAIDKIAYAPLREAPRLSVLITAIGVSYFSIIASVRCKRFPKSFARSELIRLINMKTASLPGRP